jgi:hypothetical protein
MIKKIEDKLDDEAYRFIRMGEESGGDEIEGCGFDNIYVSREIVY